MATDTLSAPAAPVKPSIPVQGDPERPTSKIIPFVLLVLMLGAILFAIWRIQEFIKFQTEGSANQVVELVWLRFEQSVKPYGSMTMPPAAALFGTLGLTALLGYLVWQQKRAHREEYAAAGPSWMPTWWHWFLTFFVAGAVFDCCAVAVLGQADARLIVLFGCGGALGIYFLIVVMLANFFRRSQPTNWILRTAFLMSILALTYAAVAALTPATRGSVNPRIFWGAILGFYGLIASTFVVWMYVLDSAAVGWLWGSFLGLTRSTAYACIAIVFLLPALQTWDKTESYSRVLILIDLSGSMTLSDEIDSDGKPGKTRLEYVNDLLTEDDGKFFKGLQEHNPVYVFGFGGATDLDPQEFEKKTGGKDPARWSHDDWSRWMRLDLQQWVLTGLSPEGRAIVENYSKYKNEQKVSQEQWAAEFFKDNQALLAQLEESDKKRRSAAPAPAAKPDKKSKGAPAPVAFTADKEKMEDKARNLEQKLKTRYQILSGTNYGDALMSVFSQQDRHMLAGMIVIGDFNSNQGSDATFQDVRARSIATKTPIYTIGIGEERPKIEIRITDLQAPSKASPQDSFVVRVEVDGEGILGKDGQPVKLPIYLDIFKAGDAAGSKPIMTITGEVEFKATGGPVPHGQVEFKFDPEAENMLPLRATEKSKDGKEDLTKEFAPAEYKLVARMAKVKGEMFAGKEHVSDMPVTVSIVKRALRVLLVAGGPSKDYQFCRRLFMNERKKGLAELCVFLQVSNPAGARAQDVPENQLLKKFPDSFNVEPEKPTDKPEEAYYNLAKYDVIICFDPDWTKIAELDPQALPRLKKWVELQAGGLVIVAGINTHKLTEKANQAALQPIIDLLPVIVDDDRNFTELEKPTDKPFPLKFPSTGTGDADFMKLDDNSTYALAGWNEFFYGKPRADWKPDDPLLRGFHRCYPAKKAKGTATVLATFPDPVVREDGKIEDQPYIATMPYPDGRIVYLAGEVWRLRHSKKGEEYHDRFYTKLARYAGAGALKKESRSRGVLVMGRQFLGGRDIVVDAKLRSNNIQEPLPRDARPLFRVVPAGVALPKPVSSGKLQDKKGGTWDGWFTARIRDLAPGKYTLELDVPDSSEVLRQDFFVKESNRELDDTRPNKDRMYLTASPISDLRLSDASKKQQLETLLAAVSHGEGARDSEPHLYFDLKTARQIPEFLSPRSESHSNKGQTRDLWSMGPDMEPQEGQPWLIDKLLSFIRWFGLALGINPSKEMTLAFPLLLVVALLSIEWLTRKLLKLA